YAAMGLSMISLPNHAKDLNASLAVVSAYPFDSEPTEKFQVSRKKLAAGCLLRHPLAGLGH
ncbi:MAG TPA: hypothetical protein VK805_00845, partial [Candidatus Baltobacteraceae bacterium]|nr:hypothetical protein [Candidatus Baltobacteraceae bacterium]